MSNRILIAMLLSLLCSQCIAASKTVLIAFPKEAKISDNSCTFYLRDKSRFCDDGVIELKYEVDEVLLGNYEKQWIEVIDFVHESGFPDYLNEFPVMLIIAEGNGYNFLLGAAGLIDLGESDGVCIDNIGNLINSNSASNKAGRHSDCNFVMGMSEFKVLINSK